MIKESTETRDNSEIIDIVDDNDVIIGLRKRDEVHRLGLLHREVHVWLFDKEKNIYFQKSPAHKSSAGLMDASIGGHLNQGEEYLEAAVRETKEESGLSILESDLILLTKFTGIKKHEKFGRINNFIRSVYVYKHPVSDGELKADPLETDGFHKFSPDYLSNLSKEDELLFHKFIPTHELPFVLKYLQKI